MNFLLKTGQHFYKLQLRCNNKLIVKKLIIITNIYLILQVLKILIDDIIRTIFSKN